MIGLLHGYLLDGSGSNLWTRAIAEATCRRGRDLHLVCQERHPERFPFVSEAWVHDGGQVECVHRADTGLAGRCVLHRPEIGDTLPVYVWDHYDDFARVVPMVELDDAALETYLTRNVEVVKRLVRDHDLHALHANHAVLMSTVAQRVGLATGVPYAVMPHGSAIEYAVKKDPRFHRYASDALGAARTIFTVGPEIVERLGRVFPEQALADRMVGLNLGVDTSAFSLRQSDRALADLRTALKGLECASGPDAHDRKLPDAEFEDRMAGVAPGDPLLLFVGRLIASKGPQAVIAALPDILAAQPAARLICVGHGPLRPCLESMVKALAQGDIAGLRELARAHDLTEVSAYLAQVDLEVYAASAREHVCAQRVIFSGYLTHRELRHLFAACQVAVFPSVVAEAGPLVFLEALASGCFPIGTYFAGMGASIDAIGSALPAEDAEVMKLRREPEHLVADIAHQVGAAFLLRGRHRNSLREIAVERYDWRQVAERWKVGLVGK